MAGRTSSDQRLPAGRERPGRRFLPASATSDTSVAPDRRVPYPISLVFQAW